MIAELVAPVLVIVVGFLIREGLKLLKVEIDEGTFNSIVASIVVYLLSLLGVTAGATAGLW